MRNILIFYVECLNLLPKPQLIAMDITTKYFPEEYRAPALRVIDTELETSFLQSNLEPIDGGGDPDIDW